MVPDGPLNTLPFDLLPLSDQELVVDRVATVYAPSSATVVHLDRPEGLPDSSGVLAIGEVDYRRRKNTLPSGSVLRATLDRRARPWPRLAATGRELEAVRSVARPGEAVTILQERAATERRFAARPDSRTFLR